MKKTNKKQENLYLNEIDRLINKSKPPINYFSIANEIFNKHVIQNNYETLSSIMTSSLIPFTTEDLKTKEHTAVLNKLIYITLLHMLKAAKEEDVKVDLVLKLLNDLPEQNIADFIDDTTGHTILHNLFMDLDRNDALVLLHNYEKLHQFINKLDNFGNSALHYIIEKNEIRDTQITDLMNQFNLKYIKNNREVANIFHILAKRGIEFIFDHNIKINVNDQDLYQGKTPLHYALYKQKDSEHNVTELLNAGADFLLKDKSGKTALDYAILYGHQNSVRKMLAGKMDNIITDEYTDKNSTRSFLASAAYSRKQELMNFLKDKIHKTPSPIDKLLIEYEKILTSNDNTKQKLDVLLDKIETQYTPEQRLIFIYSAASNFFLDEEKYPEKLLNNIIDKLIKAKNSAISALRVQNITPFPEGKAYGIELEMANIPEIVSTAIETEMLLSFFPLQLVKDVTVTHNLMLQSDLGGNEFISNILDNPDKAADFLTAIQYLHESQAMTNTSTGMHIHVNIRGNTNEELSSIAASITDDPLEFEEVELNIVKQILLNWSQLEPLLLGFMRSGDMYDLKSTSDHYAAPLQDDIKNLLAADNFETMTDVLESRFKAINVRSLNLNNRKKGHGTLEFRMHEGTTDPIIIKAWLNFIDRLVSISVDQVKNNNNQFTNKPYPNIEDLSYILIWERDYNKTWSKDSGTPHTAAIPAAQPDKKGKTMQEEIQESEFYKALDGFHLYKAKQKNNTDYKQKELLRIVELLKAYPGVFPRKPIHKKNKKNEPGVLHRKNSLH